MIKLLTRLKATQVALKTGPLKRVAAGNAISQARPHLRNLAARSYLVHLCRSPVYHVVRKTIKSQEVQSMTLC
jgi:hypothetical protein